MRMPVQDAQEGKSHTHDLHQAVPIAEAVGEDTGRQTCIRFVHRKAHAMAYKTPN